MDLNADALSRQPRNVGTNATLTWYFESSTEITPDHHSGERFSAANGDTTNRPSESRNAAGDAAKSASAAAMRAWDVDGRAAMSGIAMTANPSTEPTAS